MNVYFHYYRAARPVRLGFCGNILQPALNLLTSTMFCNTLTTWTAPQSTQIWTFGERRQGYHLWKVGSQASRLFAHHLLWRHRRTAPQASRNTRATQNGKHNWHTGWLAHVTTNMCCPFCSTPDSSLQSRNLEPSSERRSLPEAPVKESKIASQRASWFFCARNRISQKVLRGR